MKGTAMAGQLKPLKFINKLRGKISEKEKQLQEAKKLAAKTEALLAELAEKEAVIVRLKEIAANSESHLKAQLADADRRLFEADQRETELKISMRQVRMELGDLGNERNRLDYTLADLRKAYDEFALKSAKIEGELKALVDKLQTRIKELEAKDHDTKKLRRRLEDAHRDNLNMARELRIHGHLSNEEYVKLAAQRALDAGAEPNVVLQLLAKNGKLEGRWTMQRIDDDLEQSDQSIVKSVRETPQGKEYMLDLSGKSLAIEHEGGTVTGRLKSNTPGFDGIYGVKKADQPER
jgi:DNA repair exonuclease SbcCD ATPase subunit